MTDDEARELLIEQVIAAWRPRTAEGGPKAHPAWHDLDAAGRIEAARRAAQARRMESALDPDGLSTTGHAVLARIRNRP